MKVYLIKTDNMGGSKILKTAYLHKDTCDLICKEKDEEWTKHKSVEADGEEISNHRVIVDGTVYNLNKSEANSVLAAQILKKLTPAEIAILKKYFS